MVNYQAEATMDEIKVLVFDLDDTLYPEITFVQSGFHAVSTFLEKTYGLPKEDIYELCLQVLEEKGRGSIFDTVLEQYGLKSKALIQKCLSEYRKHKPTLTLYEDAERFLNSFKDLPLYIVTDGNLVVQHNKIEALSLQKYMKKIFLTRRFGTSYEKPSPYCFQKIQVSEQVSPYEVVYVGDNPNKDFVGIKPLGFRTIRLLRGGFQDVRLGSEYEAELEIKSFEELFNILKRFK